MSELQKKAEKVKAAAQQLNTKNTNQKNKALNLIADQLKEDAAEILMANEIDIAKARQNGFHESLIDRLILNRQRIFDMADAIKQLVQLEDPVGEVLESWERPNGLHIEKVRVPLGVVGMIYEARPNVTVDASSLCLKTGNAVLLRGSSSAIHSNTAIVTVIKKALRKSEIPVDAVQLLEDTNRETASEMFRLNGYLDVLIPRGGKALIQTVVEQSTVPVLETGAGNCHIYIDASADHQMAVDIAVNAKTQRPSVCNAVETVIVHQKWAESHLQNLVSELQRQGVEIRADEMTRSISPTLAPAVEKDWETEYLDKILAVKTVRNMEEAISHINRYSSKHSEAIISESEENVLRFFNEIDAAALYHNASTRFTDGFEFGFGAEIGISTQKLHARGPMGLPALTTTKFTIRGSGQTKG